MLHGVSIGSAAGYDNASPPVTMTEAVLTSPAPGARGDQPESPVSCVSTAPNHVRIASSAWVSHRGGGGRMPTRRRARAPLCRAAACTAPGARWLRSSTPTATVGDGLAGFAIPPHRSDRRTVEERSPVKTELRAVARCYRWHESQCRARCIPRGDPPHLPTPRSRGIPGRALSAGRSPAPPLAPHSR